jgi:bacterioferritin
MASDKLMKMLNDAVARELQVSIQYMWQHVQKAGVKGEVAADIFKRIAVAEMKHAEDIAERLNFLGGTPTTVPSKIEVGGNTVEMMKLDIKAEQEAIEMYREIIELAQVERDYTTETLFKRILADEEEHLDNFQSFLED